MKPSKHSSSPRRLGSSITFALTFALASLSLAGACDVEDADVPIADEVEFIDDEELRAAVLAPTSPQELEARGLSEEDVASFESSIEELVSEEDDPSVTACGQCAPFLGKNCKMCCTSNLQVCNLVCGPPYCP
jgi:hypothetical protein